MEASDQNPPSSQVLRDALVVEDMHVREPDDNTIVLGWVSSNDDEFNAFVKFVHHPSGQVAVYTRERRRKLFHHPSKEATYETWGAGTPLEEGDLRVLSQWIQAAIKQKEADETP